MAFALGGRCRHFTCDPSGPAFAAAPGTHAAKHGANLQLCGHVEPSLDAERNLGSLAVLVTDTDNDCTGNIFYGSVLSTGPSVKQQGLGTCLFRFLVSALHHDHNCRDDGLWLGHHRFGCRRLLAWYQVPMALGYVVFAYGTTLGHAAIGFMLMGLMQGGGATLFNAAWAEFYGTRHLGSVKSVATALMVFGSALGPGLTGLLIDFGIPFQDQMAFFAVYILAACLLTYFAMLNVRVLFNAPA